MRRLVDRRRDASKETEAQVDAIEGNLAEVQVGKLAQEKGQRADVKSFGQMLASDHGGANQKAMQVASQLGVTPPSQANAHQSALDRMSVPTFARNLNKMMGRGVETRANPISQVRFHALSRAG